MKILVIGIIFLFLSAGFYVVFYEYEHPCLESHREMVHHLAWTQMITTSLKPLIMIPIYHPAYDAEEEICDKRKS